MAVSIERQPTGPIYSVSDAMYVITSDQINQLEFSFVVDVYVGSERIARLLKQPNPTGTGVFNLQRIFDANLDYDINSLGQTTSTTGARSTKTFQIRFAEEYLVNNELSILPTSATSNDLVVVKGVQEHNTVDVGASTVSGRLSRIQPGVTNRIHRGDDLTISYYNSSANTVVHDVINIPSSGSTYSQVVNGETYNFEIYDVKSYLGEERFAWFNEIGGIDYITTTRERTQEVSVERDTYKGSHLRWGRATTGNKEAQNADVFISSTKNIRNNFTTTSTAMLPFLDDNGAELAVGLLASRRAFVQRGDKYVPVDILNGSYRTKLPTLVPENYSFPVMYRLSNDKRRF